MKRLLCLILSIAIFMSVALSCGISAYAEQKGERLGDTNTYYSYDNNGVLTIFGNGNMPNFTVSDESTPWFEYRDFIKRIVVEEGVTSIGAYCFYYCGASEYILPSTLSTIGNYSIANNHNLTSIDIPFGTKSIGQYAIYNCTKLKDVTLSSTVTTIGARAFQSCTSIEEITIPHSVTNIGLNAFNICTKLRSVNFQSLTAPITFGSNVFTGCSALKSLTIPMNSTCGTRFFGYMNTSTKYSGISMQVYRGSNAENYGNSNNIPMTYFDTIPVECGVDYVNNYTTENYSKSFHYSFVADSSGEYCFYTKGSVDLRAELYHNGALVAEADDISPANTNPSITINCVEGDVYDLYISSNKATGRYALIVLPTDIVKFSVKGESSASASILKGDEQRYLETNNEMLDGKLFTVEYANGLVHRFYYEDIYYDGKDISFKNEKEYGLACGRNDVAVTIGDVASTTVINIEHSYSNSIVQPTPDEDGYTLNKCINCDDSYKTDYFKTDRTIYTLTGRCVLSEDKYGNHSIDLPYSDATIRVGRREYSINPDGTWEIRTFDTCEAVFDNHNGMNVTIQYVVDKDNINQEYGIIALNGYDFNADGYVNARDFAIYSKEKKDTLCDGYWQFADNFITTH